MKKKFKIFKALSVLCFSVSVFLMCSLPVSAKIRHHFHHSSSGITSNLMPKQTQWFVIIFVIVFVGISIMMLAANKKGKAFLPSTFVPTDYSQRITAKIREHDAAFDSAELYQYSENVFRSILNASSNSDYEVLRNIEDGELFIKHCAQIKNLERRMKHEMFKDISVSDYTMPEYRINADTEQLSVYLSGVMKNYIVHSKKMNLVLGSKSQAVGFKYILTFTRSKYSVSFRSDIVRCPSCGETVDPNVSRCPLCGTFAPLNNNGWTLTGLERLKADSKKIPNGGIIIE